MTLMTIVKNIHFGLEWIQLRFWEVTHLEVTDTTKENDYTAGHTKFWHDDGRDKFFLAKKTSRLKALSYE